MKARFGPPVVHVHSDVARGEFLRVIAVSGYASCSFLRRTLPSRLLSSSSTHRPGNRKPERFASEAHDTTTTRSRSRSRYTTTRHHHQHHPSKSDARLENFCIGQQTNKTDSICLRPFAWCVTRLHADARQQSLNLDVERRKVELKHRVAARLHERAGDFDELRVHDPTEYARRSQLNKHAWDVLEAATASS